MFEGKKTPDRRFKALEDKIEKMNKYELVDLKTKIEVKNSILDAFIKYIPAALLTTFISMFILIPVTGEVDPIVIYGLGIPITIFYGLFVIIIIIIAAIVGYMIRILLGKKYLMVDWRLHILKEAEKKFHISELEKEKEVEKEEARMQREKETQEEREKMRKLAEQNRVEKETQRLKKELKKIIVDLQVENVPLQESAADGFERLCGRTFFQNSKDPELIEGVKKCIDLMAIKNKSTFNPLLGGLHCLVFHSINDDYIKLMKENHLGKIEELIGKVKGFDHNTEKLFQILCNVGNEKSIDLILDCLCRAKPSSSRVRSLISYVGYSMIRYNFEDILESKTKERILENPIDAANLKDLLRYLKEPKEEILSQREFIPKVYQK